jgi:predicted helicase
MISNGTIRSDSVSIDTSFPVFRVIDDGTTVSNLSPTAVKALAAKLDHVPNTTDIVSYAYAVLHSPSYRDRFLDRLRLDYPKIPVIASQEELDHLIGCGDRLRELHLLRAGDVDGLSISFPMSGSNEVSCYRYDGEAIWINDEQYFGQVPVHAWDFWVGGYQPAQKWLKDRKGQVLEYEDIEHYKVTLEVLVRTVETMEQIDSYPLSWIT